MKELVIKNTVPAIIEWDKEKALKEAKEIMAKYEGLEFAEDDLKLAKKEVATLRKVSKEINAQALAVDKELTASVKEFRAEVNEVKVIVDNGISFINEQVKTFENKQAEERKAVIIEFEEFEQISKYISFDDEWLKKKWTDKALKELINNYAEQIDREKSSIKLLATSHGLDSEFYLTKHVTTPADKVLERIVEDASRQNKKVEKEEKVVVVDIEEKKVTITRQLKGTVSALKVLKDYAEQLGIEWIK